MNPGQFIDFIDHPYLLDAASRAGLDEIIREYPFCQPAQLLYLKTLQLEGSVRFNKQLKVAAIYAGSRKALFELLDFPKIPVGYPEQVPAEPIPELLPESLEINEPIAQATEKELVSFDLIPFAETLPGPSDNPMRLAYIAQLERFVPITPVDLLSFDFSPGDNDILDIFMDNQVKPEPPKKIEPEPAAEHEELAEFRFEDSDHGKKPPEARQKQDQNDLIERFIAGSSSKVIKPNAPPVSEEDRSLASLREDEEILTETLARIYIQQGYYMKAIMSYQKLSLKYPEKSVYFASQIEMVRELIKNQ